MRTQRRGPQSRPLPFLQAALNIVRRQAQGPGGEAQSLPEEQPLGEAPLSADASTRPAPAQSSASAAEGAPAGGAEGPDAKQLPGGSHKTPDGGAKGSTSEGLKESTPPEPASVPPLERIVVDADNLGEYAGVPGFKEERLYQERTPVGVVTGLAWTAMGGSTLYIETTAIEQVGHAARCPPLSQRGLALHPLSGWGTPGTTRMARIVFASPPVHRQMPCIC